MTASRGTAAVTQTTAVAALTAARTPKISDSSDSAFGDQLSAAQHPAKKPSGTPVSGGHQDPHQRQQQPPERDIPRHQVLRGKSGQVSTTSRTTPVTRKPVLLHPMTTDFAAAAAVQAQSPVALQQQPTAKTGPTTAAATSGVAATAAPGNPASAAPTAPATTALVAGNSLAATLSDPQQTAAPAAGSPAGQAQPPSPVQITVTTPLTTPEPTAVAQTPAEAPAQPPAQVLPPAPAQPDPATTTPAPPQVTADATAVTQPTGQHHPMQGQPDPAQPTTQTAVTVTTTATDRETADQGPSQQPGHDAAPTSHGHVSTGDAAPAGAPATPYSSVTDRTQLTATTASAPADARTTQEVPATQALPPGTLAQVNAAEHSVRVQMETQALGKVTAEMHTRPGEIGVHLSVPDDAGRALMAQRLDALRDSLGQGGSAVHLSLAAQGNFPQGQQSSTPREDRASAQSAPQPHDAATPRATDGSPMTPAPADGTRLVDVHA